jgi:hypothetical protein
MPPKKCTLMVKELGPVATCSVSAFETGASPSRF